MTDVNKRETPTAVGDVTYETVECDSCGAEVLTDDAKQFFVGDVDSTRVFNFRDVKEVQFDGESVVSGWACPYCYDDGPIGFPNDDRGLLGRTLAWVRGLDVFTAIMLSLALMMGLMVTMIITAS